MADGGDRRGSGKLVADFFTLRATLDEHTATRTGGAFFEVAAARLLGNIAFDLVRQPLITAIVIVMVAAPACYAWVRSDRLKRVLVLEATAVAHIVLFLCFGQIYLEGNYQRIFIPTVGLIYAFSLCGGYDIVRLLVMRLIGQSASVVAATLLCAAIVGLTMVAYRPLSYDRPPVSLHRKLYDATKGRVTVERKLLLPARFALDADWVGIGSRVYLDGAVVPVYLASELEQFDRFIVDHSIRYVLVARTYIGGLTAPDQIERIFSLLYGSPLPGEIRNNLSVASQEIWRGETRVVWSPEACQFEAEVLGRLMLGRQGKLVAKGETYELP